MKSILLVSHSKKITDGLKELIEEMTNKNPLVNVRSVGGTHDNHLGTDATKILKEINNCQNSDTIFVFCDIGSAILSAQMAIELIEDRNILKKVILVDAPLIEGAFAASIRASFESDNEKILEEVEFIKTSTKF